MKFVWQFIITGAIAVAAVALVKRIPNQKLV